MMTKLTRGIFFLILTVGGFARAYNPDDAPASTRGMIPADQTPAQIKNIGITEKLGDSIDLSLPVTNEQGVTAPLKSFFEKGRPVILSLVYFNCPNLCNLHLNAVVGTLKSINLKAGKDYELIALSFDPKETSALAYAKKQTYLKLFDSPGGEEGFHFLVAPATTSLKLADSIGFKYEWDKESGQYAHASAAVIISPNGVITHYFHGMTVEPKDFKLALIDASSGKVGTFLDQMVWYCYHYDPHQSKYTIYAMRLVQLGGIIMICLLGMLLLRRKFQW